MSETNAVPAADEPFFRALLTPHRSLGRTGFALLMAGLLTGWIITGAIFVAHGAWPVSGFLGLDVLFVYGAFRLNYRAARVREEVSVSRTCLRIRKVAASGKAEQHRFNPFWARFSVARHTEIGITRMAVEGHGLTVPIGTFLNPGDRDSFALAFSCALATARGR
ncbi:MAG: hypothetical protein K0Q60_3521 [Microvirga sp.]|jgi:uncharacterized membrane protein|nr:hypothetical protein [Microvirga sp.]